jgi:hypothetical protein
MELSEPEAALRRQMLYPTELRAHSLHLTHCTALIAFFATGNCAGAFSLCPILCPPSREIASRTASSEGWT